MYFVVTGVLRSTRQVEVTFVDYGNNDQVSESDLRDMKPAFMGLEAQAIRCALAGVDDVTADWPDDAIDSFQDQILSTDVIKVISLNSACSIVTPLPVKAYARTAWCHSVSDSRH